MNHDEFVSAYRIAAKKIIEFANKARREGLLAVDEYIDRKEVAERNVFEYGISFVVDGVDASVVNKILSNLIEQEKDEYTKLLKRIQKEAVLLIQAGDNPRVIAAVLNSYTDLMLTDDDCFKDEVY